jgi:hypothetical protein
MFPSCQHYTYPTRQYAWLVVYTGRHVNLCFILNVHLYEVIHHQHKHEDIVLTNKSCLKEGMTYSDCKHIFCPKSNPNHTSSIDYVQSKKKSTHAYVCAHFNYLYWCLKNTHAYVCAYIYATNSRWRRYQLDCTSGSLYTILYYMYIANLAEYGIYPAVMWHISASHMTVQIHIIMSYWVDIV